MIKVHHTQHSIDMPRHLQNQLYEMGTDAAFLKLQGEEEESQKVLQEAVAIYNQWKNTANQSVASKSHTDWLGGGESYVVLSSHGDPTQAYNDMLNAMKSLGDKVYCCECQINFKTKTFFYGNKMSNDNLLDIKKQLLSSQFPTQSIYQHIRRIDDLIKAKENEVIVNNNSGKGCLVTIMSSMLFAILPLGIVLFMILVFK